MATKDTATQAATTAAQTLTLNQKILAVKSEVGVIAQDSDAVVGGGKKIFYASLTAIYKALIPILAKYHLDYEISCVLNQDTYPLLGQGLRVFRLCFIDTDTGEVSERIVYPFRLANNPEQIKADGSTLTYIARYLLGLAFGLQTELDPDANFDNKGNGDNGKKNGAKSQQPAPPQPKQDTPKYPFETLAQNFYRLCNEGNVTDAKQTLAYIIKYFGGDKNRAPEIAQMQNAPQIN